MRGLCETLGRERDNRLKLIEEEIIDSNPLFLESTYAKINSPIYYSKDTVFNKIGSLTISVLRKYYVLSGVDFCSVVDYISEKRSIIAHLDNSLDKEDFGKTRFPVNDDTLSLTTPLKTIERSQVVEDYLQKFRDENIVRIDDRTRGGCRNQVCEILTTFPDLPGCSTKIFVNKNSKYFIDELDITPSAYSRKYQELFDDALNSFSIEKVATLHWYLDRLTPIVRGGGTLAEWICIPMIDFKRWKVETWSRACVYELSRFQESYLTFFD